MADLSTKSISQLDDATSLSQEDLFFISKLNTVDESGQKNWQSYKTTLEQVANAMEDTYDELYLGIDALEGLSDRWDYAYDGVNFLSSNSDFLSQQIDNNYLNCSLSASKLSTDVMFLSQQIDNNYLNCSLSADKLCAEISSTNQKFIKYVLTTDVVQTLGNSTSKVPSQSLLNSLSVSVANGYQQKLVGKSGEVAYLNTDGVLKQQILDQDYYICENDAEIELCKQNKLQFKDIYEIWDKCGNIDDEWYGFTPNYPVTDSQTKRYGINDWYYDSTDDTIVQPKNVDDNEGFISISKYNSYDITIRCYSSAPDDDFLGIIAGYAVDPNKNKPVMLVIYRSTRDTWDNAGTYESLDAFIKYFSKNRWGIFCFDGEKRTSVDHSSMVLKFSDEYSLSSEFTPGTPQAYGWNREAGGVKIRVRRQDNMISAWTTILKKNSTADQVNDQDLTCMFTFDLTDAKYDNLSALRSGGSIGYYTNLQADSKYENIENSIPKSIIDARINSLSTYNPITDEWVKESKIPMNEVGYGRLSRNIITKKNFYVGSNSFINMTRGLGAKDIWAGTLAEYNALPSKNSNTIYYCKE